MKSKTRDDETLFGSLYKANPRRGNKEKGWLQDEHVTLTAIAGILK